MDTQSELRPVQEPLRFGTSFRNVGLLFAGLGVAAIAAPAVATLIVEQLVAWLLVFWGLAGIAFALSFRAYSEWRIVAVVFASVLIAGLIFVVFPGRGAALLTGLMVVVFLIEGVLSILLGLRLSGQIPRWRWVIASGACAFLLGVSILVQWPTTSTWVLGFLAGLNFLSTGLAMFMLSRTALGHPQ
ncbi:HdeD family acid-resistance protein [Pararhodobacter sp.]|uniref:HdeD family acid-resistance protein n=1 Tax=Pararhodobacter sp. TaxID=2127056 RepID=UPI002AFF312A|nr:DUF308 domain-containing protein [Pararhodobacter sp.]